MSRYKAELEQDDDGRWSAWIDKLPGCAAWGYSREEALVALEDAAIAYVEDMMTEFAEVAMSVRPGAPQALERGGVFSCWKVEGRLNDHRFPAEEDDTPACYVPDTRIPSVILT